MHQVLAHEYRQVLHDSNDHETTLTSITIYFFPLVCFAPARPPPTNQSRHRKKNIDMIVFCLFYYICLSFICCSVHASNETAAVDDDAPILSANCAASRHRPGSFVRTARFIDINDDDQQCVDLTIYDVDHSSERRHTGTPIFSVLTPLFVSNAHSTAANDVNNQSRSSMMTMISTDSYGFKQWWIDGSSPLQLHTGTMRVDGNSSSSLPAMLMNVANDDYRMWWRSTLVQSVREAKLPAASVLLLKLSLSPNSSVAAFASSVANASATPAQQNSNDLSSINDWLKIVNHCLVEVTLLLYF
jgi:hypothetical protein